MSDLTRNLVDAIISGKATAIEDSFQAAMSDKISSAMQERKEELAQGLFRESAGAYELYNPKHPNFVKNHTKWKKNNPDGKLSDFIEHMKSKERGVKEDLTLEDYSIDELEDYMMSEEFEQLDEVSQGTLDSYRKKSFDEPGEKREAGRKLAFAKSAGTSGDAKVSATEFVTKAKSEIKDLIKPEHHDKYPISKITGYNAAHKIYKDASAAGHLKEEVEELDD